MRINLNKNSILINAYNRLNELENCLNHILGSSNINNFNIVITYQIEIENVSKFIVGLKNDNITKLGFNGINRSPIHNININRISGLKYCFNVLKSEFVIAVEDDINIGYDTLNFCDFIYSKYKFNKYFMGINLCSNLPFDSLKNNLYGKFRYGVSGQCSLITNTTWNKIIKHKILSLKSCIGFDSQIEHFLKTGFMVHPYNSRYIDNGWNGGTHAPKDRYDVYYQLLIKSWVGKEKFETTEYKEMVFDIKWRKDCIRYKKFYNLVYLLRFYMYKLNLNYIK